MRPNHTALSPVSILKRVERVYPELFAQIHGDNRRNWGQVAERCNRLASPLSKRGIGKGDAFARLEICDRSKDVIISGGENISPIEVEKVIYSDPPVSFAAIVAMPGEKWLKVPSAFVELSREASEQELLDQPATNAPRRRSSANLRKPPQERCAKTNFGIGSAGRADHTP
jgi:acyl-CoA synthetase (AMP-forming)/AMP-acid ligase II